jgi:hypothetical protein
MINPENYQINELTMIELMVKEENGDFIYSKDTDAVHKNTRFLVLSPLPKSQPIIDSFDEVEKHILFR